MKLLHHNKDVETCVYKFFSVRLASFGLLVQVTYYCMANSAGLINADFMVTGLVVTYSHGYQLQR